jgi:hypothetical protein
MIIVAVSPSIDFTAVPNRERERRAAKEKKHAANTSSANLQGHSISGKL